MFGRAEARDFVDLSVLTKQYGLERLLRGALNKDPGFDPQIFGQMLRHFNRLPQDEFEISDQGYESLVRAIDHWQEIVNLTQDRLQQKRGPGPGDDLGLGR